MKKVGAALLAALLVLALAGCGSKDSEEAANEVYAEDGYGEGRMGDTMHTYFFDYTVNSAYVCGTYEGYIPADGNELLVAEVTVKNASAQSIPMWDDDFQAQWNEEGNDDAYSWPITEDVEPVSSEQLPAEYDLAAEEERTGLLVFEVPAGNQDFSISYRELFDNGTAEGEPGDTFFVFFTAESK